MKKYFRKAIALFISSALLAALATGCGAKNDEEALDPDAIAYRPEYQSLDLGDFYPNAILAQGDYMYLLMNEWSETTMQSAYKIIKISLVDGSKEEIPLFPMGQNEYTNTMVLNAQGNFLLLANAWSEDGSSTQTLYEASAVDGTKIAATDIGSILNLGPESWMQGMYSDDENKLYFVTGGGGMNMSYQLTALDEAGQLLGKIEYNDYIENVVCSADGAVYITTWGERGMVLKQADFAAGSFGNDIKLEGMGSRGNLRFAAGGPTGLLASDGTNLLACDIPNSAASVVLNWLDCDVNANNLQYFGQLNDGSFWVYNINYGRSGTSSSELIVLHQTTVGELPPRETLVFGTLYLDGNLQEAILDFNKTNQQYRIQVVEYYDQDNYENSIITFNTALTRADGPDLIDLSNANFTQLAAKRALEDLNPYFDRHGLNRNDYLENVLNAYDVNGKLYGVMTDFYFSVLVGHASKLQGIDTWTVEEMIRWAESYPEAQLMNTTSSQVLYAFTYSLIGNFVDWESGKVNFASDEFISILEFAALFGEDYEDWNDPDRVGTHEGLASGKYLLMEQSINELSYMQLMDAMFDGEAKFIGYPTETGSGILLMPRSSLGINAKSRHKEGAFAFINYLLSDAYQNISEDTYRWGIPVKRSGVEALIAMQTTPPDWGGGSNVTVTGDASSTWSSGDMGEMVGAGEPGEAPLTSWGYDDLNVEIYASRNKNYIDTFYDLIASASGIRQYDTSVSSIITEETEPFVAGQKTAREVAEIIQNRVQVYVNENR
jgi:ABC-type glycerol-3-phosphate transport system substrate-binding protein